MNFTTTHIRSEKVTIDTRIYTILNGKKSLVKSISLPLPRIWS